MRLLLSLKALQAQEYETSYYYHLQAFIYNTIKNSEFKSIHDKLGNKFFSFSNIFPVGNFSVGDLRKVLIASPDPHLISYIASSIEETGVIRIGRMTFALKESRIFELDIKNQRTTAVTSTPLLVRMSREKCEKIGLALRGTQPDVYWRLGFPLDLLQNEVLANLEKKYKDWYRFPPTLPVLNFEECMRQIAVPVTSKRFTSTVIGTIWKLSLEADDSDQLKAVEFAFDAGLGHRNSLGFGFLNPLH